MEQGGCFLNFLLIELLSELQLGGWLSVLVGPVKFVEFRQEDENITDVFFLAGTCWLCFLYLLKLIISLCPVTFNGTVYTVCETCLYFVFSEPAVWMSPHSCTSPPLPRSFMSHSSRASLGLYKESYRIYRILYSCTSDSWSCFFLCFTTSFFFSTAQSPRSCSPTSHRWMSRMKVTSTFPQPSLQPSAVRSWPTRACTTPPPRSTALVPAALVWLEHT